MPKKIGDLELYDVEELAELLGIQAKTIRKLLREGRIRGRKLARRWYVSAASIEEYFGQQEPDKRRSGGADR